MARCHPFDADTAVSDVGDGRYEAILSDRWSLVGGHANGGYGLVICLQALRAQATGQSGWPACRASTRHVIDGYHDEDFEIWDATGQLVAQSRQLALLPRGRRQQGGAYLAERTTG